MVFAVFGNDDPRVEEEAMRELERRGLLVYLHGVRHRFRGHRSLRAMAASRPPPSCSRTGSATTCRAISIPPTSRPRRAGAACPSGRATRAGGRSPATSPRWPAASISSEAIFLFHAPPYGTPLDRAALDGRVVDHAPLDPHVGSIAIRRFLEARQPLSALSGHVHESARLTGDWRTRLGRTVCLSAAHDGTELALVRFAARRARRGHPRAALIRRAKGGRAAADGRRR